MDTTGNLKITVNNDAVIQAYQHIDNGGVAWTYDRQNGTLTVDTSFFGYGNTSVTLPFFNSKEMIKFLNQIDS